MFLTDEGEPFNIEAVSSLFKLLQRRTGIQGKQVSPHNCRRYMATIQLAAGRSPLDVQHQMGHTTLQMTNHYASLIVQQLRKSHEAFSPPRVRNIGDTREFSNGYWDE